MDAPIVCTLTPDGLGARVGEFASLHRRFLRGTSRVGRTAEVRFAPEAAAELDALMTQERECCAFLTFEVSHDAQAVTLRVTVPERAANDADALLEPFLPAATEPAAGR